MSSPWVQIPAIRRLHKSRVWSQFGNNSALSDTTSKNLSGGISRGNYCPTYLTQREVTRQGGTWEDRLEGLLLQLKHREVREERPINSTCLHLF